MSSIMKRLAILSTHPIQYNAPLFRILHEDDSIELCVFFSKTWDQVKFDPDFQREIVWDIPVFEGYRNSTHDASTKAGKRDLKRAIQSFQPDAILVYGWNFPGHLAMMRTFHGKIPVWFRGDSHLLDPLPLWKKIARRKLLKWVYRHIDFAFTVGTANEAYYQWCGLKPRQWIRAPHAVNNVFFEKDDEERKALAMQWRTTLGISRTDRTILFAGKLEHKKQPEFLIQAWSRLDDPTCHILIVGSGPQESSLRQRWGHHPRVHFLGFQNQTAMPTLYRMADVYCLPSAGPGETWGLAVNEALASGTPCVVSDRAGCSKDMSAASNDVLVASHHNVNEWIEAIKNVLSTPQPRPSSIPSEFNHTRFVQAIQTTLCHG